MMFSSKRKIQFRNALELMLNCYPPGVKKLYSHFGALKKAPPKEHDEMSAADSAATFARLIVTQTIDLLTPELRDKVHREINTIPEAQLTALASKYMRDRSDTGGVEPMSIFIVASLVIADELRKLNDVSGEMFEHFKADTFDALKGMTKGQRAARSFRNIAHEVLGSPAYRLANHDPLLDVWDGPADFPTLQGRESKVHLRKTSLGVAMHDAETGDQITEPRNLTQEKLAVVDVNADPIRFVNVTANSGDLYSCLVVGESNEIVGDMRAFWWSLARNQVWMADYELHRNRLSEATMQIACAHARKAWTAAIERDPIHHMRDMIVPMRNMHFETLKRFMDDAPDVPEKLGRHVALAVVLATQSEDRLLEGHAVRRFRQFLWMSGEEPPEFREHVAGLQ